MQEEGEYWPLGYDDLVPHYERHEAMLNATPYPLRPRSVRPHLQDEGDGVRVGRRSGSSGSCRRSPSRFDPGDGRPAPGEPILGEENLHGRTRLTCLLCGECNIGCNYGAKNTLDYNYLSLAKLRHGADIRTRCEVKTFAPRDGGGYTLDYVDHDVRRAPQTPHL